MKIAILDDYQNVALKSADWSSLPEECEVEVFTEHFSSPNIVKERLRDFEVIVAMRERTPFSRDILAGLPGLKLLITTGMRNASIDLVAANDLGILVCGTGGRGFATAELAWGLILALMRHIPLEDSATRQGQWQTTIGTELMNKTLGIVGLGNLGSRMAIIGKSFEMTVIAWSQNLTSEKAAQFGATLVPKEELFTGSDIVTLHLQLSERTRGLIGRRELSLMKPTAYLINTSRGPIIDEAALIDILKSRSIAGVGLDVYDHEPLPVDHPLRYLDNTVVTPHLGYVTSETYKVFYEDSVENISSYLNGQPIRVLNP
ncbi:D-2-hydroxyacid dehydrogenase family protein [Chloroflexota bacterium]